MNCSKQKSAKTSTNFHKPPKTKSTENCRLASYASAQKPASNAEKALRRDVIHYMKSLGAEDAIKDAA